MSEFIVQRVSLDMRKQPLRHFLFSLSRTFVDSCFDFRQVPLGNRDHLSKIDIRQMNLLYKCSGGAGGGGDGGGGGPKPPPPTGFTK